jgi:hypothetical protein
MISVILENLNRAINLPDGDFGYNPTTPRGDMINN